MKTLRLLLAALLASGNLWAATTLNPTITPALFRYNTSITVVYDVTGTPLASLTEAYAWVWIPGNLTINAKYNVTPASNIDAAKFVKSTDGGKTLFTLTFVPSDFFTSDISAATQLGILLKGKDWPNGQTSDYLASFWDGSFKLQITSPTLQPLFVTDGAAINVTAETPVTADFTLKINGKVFDVQISKTVYELTLTVNDSVDIYNAELTATTGISSSVASFYYVISKQSPAGARPAGIIDGINYSADATRATLSLLAPQKTSVYVIGDFNAWKPAIMKKDGEHFWIELTGLTSGTEYAYQYLVDETLFITDPYSDKNLDRSNDPGIPATTYPGLKSYPIQAGHTEWYFNFVSILQTGQTPYVWQTNSFVKPAKEKLVIYELHIRDFFDADHRNYQSLIDTIGYFKRLGVNAIELMPITEFSGNDSWGYNPNAMFAPDKYYGTKNKLKEFVDTAHKNGIAVIMDMVMNQQDLPNAYLMMYFDFNSNPVKPLPNNPWFNVTATHPYSVFFDMNHESTYTRKYLDTINYYWTHQYKIDGFRYDLAKGFTQTPNPNNVAAWGAYDPSRIAIFKRMSDVLWANSPDSYVILEHFAENTEEKELADYRADEGKGMMLWENFNYAFGQNELGFADGSDFTAMYYANKGWNKPREVSYMESHDEERQIYKALQFGNASATYSVRNLNTALYRMKGTSLLFYTVPGAKMIWQFGELGYDKSINTCPDGTISNDCRVSAKPVLWDYATVAQRNKLFVHTADLIRLRKNYSVFTQGNAVIPAGTALIKQVNLKNSPYTDSPSDSTQMNAVAIANMDIAKQTIVVNFSHAGTWYDYYASGEAITVTGPTLNFQLEPGEFKLLTDVKITLPKLYLITGLEETTDAEAVHAYPNPAEGTLFIESATAETILVLTTLQGAVIHPPRLSDNAWDVRELSTGMYIAQVRTNGKISKIKVIKR